VLHVAAVVALARLSSVVDYYLCKRCGPIRAVRKSDPTIIHHFWAGE
jgi:hypothetical protein